VVEPPGNILYYGDNLDVLRQHIPDESVDLVYLDPPFNSNASYNVLFAEQSGERSASQIKAFEDTWRWDQAAAAAYETTVEAGGDVSRAMQAFRTILGTNNMLAYLAMMAPRLVELRRVLKPTGSLYLHCDSTASHHLKLLLDSILGPQQFRNEIVWHYRRWTGAARSFLKMHDTIFFYTKTSEYTFNRQFTPYTEKSAERKKNYHTRIKGDEVYVTSVNERGVGENDVWQIPLINSQALERMGYPTQKPEELLERIIQSSSVPGDIVLDPFCGCGTTIAVAQRLERRWIGIDVTALATSLIKTRLRDTFGEAATFHVVGEPITLADATELAATDPYQFQWWALDLVHARPAEEKKGADKGIDGRIYVHDEGPGGKTKQIILSVKAGKAQVQHLRDLRGVIDRENAQIGVLISLQPPTKPMRVEAASAGFYESPWGKHPRLQLLTVEELFDGAVIDMPPQQANVTFKRAPKAKARPDESDPLF
jgi:DNA modification methylase